MAEAEHFGAVGDGVVDDTAALEHALEAGDGVLRLRKGTYRITRPLVLDLAGRGHGAILGEGGTARITMEAAGPALRILGDHGGTALPASVQPRTWDRERFPTISGIEIVGGHADAVGIELRRTMQCLISGVLVRRCRHGVHLVDRNRNVVISDTHLYDNDETGLFVDRCNLHQMNVHGCHVSYNKRAGIRMLGGDVHNVQIVGNDVEYNHAGTAAADRPALADDGGAEIWLEADDGMVSEVTISGNTIQSIVRPGGANLRIAGRRGSRSATVLVAVTGNVIGSQSRAIDMTDAARITISGNTIYGTPDLSIAAVRCAGVAIGGNSFGWLDSDTEERTAGLRFEACDGVLVSGAVAPRLGCGAAATAAGVTLVGCTASGVSDCQILDPLHGGVELEDCVGCRVTNNTILDRREQPSMRHAIRVLGRSRGTLVSGNVVGGATQAAIEADAGVGDVRDNLSVE